MHFSTEVERQRILRMREVCAIVGLSRQTLYRYMGTTPPRFPQSIKIGTSAIGWRKGAVMDYLDEREAESIQGGSVH
jgi:predicted DNA-binding transcriptional regulator AlpA